MVTGNRLTIGQRFRIHRKNRGISQDDLALGICSRQTISLLERDNHIPAVEIMEKLADRLRVPLQEFMSEHVSALEIKVQVDIIRVYVETEDYAPALELIAQLWSNEDLLAYQRRELLLCKAECLIKTERMDEAVELLEEMQRELEHIREIDDHLMARLYDKLGTAYYYLSNMATAYAHYLHAYQLSMWFPEFDLTAARITYNLGKACRMLDRPEEAIEYLVKAEKFFSRAADAKRLAQTMFELGISFVKRKDFEQATFYMQESLLLYKSLNILSKARRVRESYAYRVLSRDNPERAVKEMLQCANECEKDGDVPLLAMTYARISSVLLQHGKPKDGEAYLQKALTLFTDAEASKNPRYAFVYQVYAQYLFATQEFEKCVEFSYKSSTIFETMELEKDAADSLKYAACAYRQRNMYEQADRVSQKIIKLLSRPFESFANEQGEVN